MRRLTSKVMVLLLGLVVAGSASASQRVAVTPLQGQAAVQQAGDAEACERPARASADGDRQQDRLYAACMVSRGYRARFAARSGVSHASFDVATATPRAAAHVSEDLLACERQVDATATGKAASAAAVSGRIGGVLATEHIGSGPHDEWTPAMEATFADCLLARGYRSAQADAAR